MVFPPSPLNIVYATGLYGSTRPAANGNWDLEDVENRS